MAFLCQSWADGHGDCCVGFGVVFSFGMAAAVHSCTTRGVCSKLKWDNGVLLNAALLLDSKDRVSATHFHTLLCSAAVSSRAGDCAAVCVLAVHGGAH